MRRRRYLAGLVAAASLASGVSGSRPTPVRRQETPVSLSQVTLPVPRSEMYAALSRDAIPAITDPAFARDWSSATPTERTDGPMRLPDDAAVVGIVRGEEARAYPLLVLDRHEVVNDRFDGPLLVTYCPVCGSVVAAERRVGAGAFGRRETLFGVSGYLWRSDLVLYDRATESLWSQILATAVNGELTGERLRLVPATLTTWEAWRDSYPDSTVLLPPPDSGAIGDRRLDTDYTEAVYSYGEEDQLVGFDSNGRLASKTLVVGVVEDGTVRAYPFETVQRHGPVHDVIGGRPVVVALTPGDTLVAYDRRVDGRVLRFEAASDRYLRAGGSNWELTTGSAVDGPFDGQRLRSVVEQSPMFWHAWEAFYPGTDIYRP